MRGNGETNLDALGKRDRTREPAKPALPDRVALLVPVRRDGGLARDAEDVVLDVDLDVLLRQAGELERGCYEVLLLVLVQVQSARACQYTLLSEVAEGTYLGRMGRDTVLVPFPGEERATAEGVARALKASSKRRSKSARE